jgi:hypothetical protein
MPKFFIDVTYAKTYSVPEQPVSRTPLWVNTYWPSTMATGF